MARRRNGFLSFISAYWSPIVLMTAPVLLMPLLFMAPNYEQESKCAYVVALMAAYWVFEVLPLAITALMPMALYPFFGIMRSEDVARAYLPDTSFLFMGGLMVAVAVEKSNLHQRIALLVLRIVGSQPKWIMAGFMGVTGFLSMWISNTATAALMVPIVQGVIMELVANNRMLEMFSLTEKANLENRRRSVELRRLSISHEHHITPAKDMSNAYSPQELQMAKGLLISICYAANIGGAATITGTASNLVLLGQIDSLFNHADTGVNFLSWLTFAFPLAVACLIVCWFILWALFLRNCPKGSPIVARKLHDKYAELPPVSFAEVSVMMSFMTMLGLWVMREPHFMPGFGSLFKNGYVTDATSAIFIVIVLFMLPDNVPKCFSAKRPRSLISQEPQRIVRGTLLDWQTIQERFPWSVVLLLGGGFALAAGVKESNLSHKIGEVMETLHVFPIFVIMTIIICITLFLTNICSNTVIASIFIPIVAELARSLHTNPLYFMLPVALASSFAFMLPVATPPNAIVFSSGVLKVKDMAIAGSMLTLACLGLTLLSMALWGPFVYPLGTFPIWAEKNSTLIAIVNNTVV